MIESGIQPAIIKYLERFATKIDLEQFATKKDLELFATKKDLEQFATKKDLEQFATKKDLERFATKEDFLQLNQRLDQFATKQEQLETRLTQRLDQHEGAIHRLSLAVVSLQEDMKEVKATLKYMTDTLPTKDYLTRMMEIMITKAEKYDQKATNHGSILVDHETTLREHEHRLKRLESQRRKLH